MLFPLVSLGANSTDIRNAQLFTGADHAHAPSCTGVPPPGVPSRGRTATDLAPKERNLHREAPTHFRYRPQEGSLQDPPIHHRRVRTALTHPAASGSVWEYRRTGTAEQSNYPWLSMAPYGTCHKHWSGGEGTVRCFGAVVLMGVARPPGALLSAEGGERENRECPSTQRIIPLWRPCSRCSCTVRDSGSHTAAGSWTTS